MLSAREAVKIGLPLLAAVYLGFYGFGLVLGVFGITEVPVFTIIAAVCVAGLVAYMVAVRHGREPIDPDGPAARAVRAQRERRGF
jgi:hypothetical protein